MRFFILILLALVPCRLQAESREDIIHLTDIFEIAASDSTGGVISIINKNIRTDDLKYRFLFEFLEFNYVNKGLLTIEKDKIVINQPITIKNCTIQAFVLNRMDLRGKLSIRNSIIEGNIEFINADLNQVIIEDCSIRNINIDHSNFKDYLLMEWNHFNDLSIESSDFHGLAKLVNYPNESIAINYSTFYPQEFPCTIVKDTIGYGRKIYDNLQLSIGTSSDETINQITMRHCRFLSNESINKVAIKADLRQMYMENNLFNSSLDLNGTVIEKRLIMRNNAFYNYVGFNDVIFSELFNIIDWEQFEGFKLCIFEPTPEEIRYECPPNYDKIRRISDLNSILYLAKNETELENKDSYNLLISIYQRLFNIYRDNGDIKSANGCYSEMKNVQARMLKHRFMESSTFNNFFRWKLAQLLKVYVDHGTDPARAITISVYVLIIFAIFYFFFPSDWDVTAKSKLLGDFSDYIKNVENRDTRKLLITLWGLFLSLMNAFILSLNAFTTLGFGNIPAQGAARYICIIQGFIGWFLLSIFTVALINQVLS